MIKTLLLLLVILFLYDKFTGPADLSRYPSPALSKYRLPYPANTRYLCVQGNRGIVSHRGWGEFSYDFQMPVGSPVVAARNGKVYYVDVSHDGQGYDAPNNIISLLHEDGEYSHYVHLCQNGSLVKVGQSVAQGQVIAESGNVGRSLLPHLHFQVVREGNTIPVSFADLSVDQGVPRMFWSYTSGNSFKTK